MNKSSKKLVSPRNAFEALPEAEKLRQLAALDAPGVFEQAKPLSKAERARWQRAKRKPGRPRQGAGAKVISLSVERKLLQEADSLARQRGLSRAQFFAMGLRQMLTSPTAQI
ncbi:MAG: hypothetical protein WCI73_12255 [Phycisphaerae bacterium]